MNSGRSSTAFSLSRVHPLEWLAALAGAGLIAGLFLPWSGGEAALSSPGFLDVVLAMIGVLAILLPVILASSSRTNVPIVYETSLWTVSLLFSVVMLVKLFLAPDGDFGSGYWLALGAVLVTAYSLWRSVDRER